MKAVTPSHLLDDPGDTSPTTRRHDVEKDSVEILERGEMFWDRIYGKISRRIMSQMERCGTEDLAVTARLMYGHILSNTQILSAPETSFVLIAGLIPQDVWTSVPRTKNMYAESTFTGQPTAQGSSQRRAECRCLQGRGHRCTGSRNTDLRGSRHAEA